VLQQSSIGIALPCAGDTNVTSVTLRRGHSEDDGHRTSSSRGYCPGRIWDGYSALWGSRVRGRKEHRITTYFTGQGRRHGY